MPQQLNKMADHSEGMHEERVLGEKRSRDRQHDWISYCSGGGLQKDSEFYYMIIYDTI